MSRVWGDFPVQLATRLLDWSAGGLLWSILFPFVRLSCRFPNFASLTRATYSRDCHEDAPSMLRGNCFCRI